MNTQLRMLPTQMRLADIAKRAGPRSSAHPCAQKQNHAHPTQQREINSSRNERINGKPKAALLIVLLVHMTNPSQTPWQAA